MKHVFFLALKGRQTSNLVRSCWGKQPKRRQFRNNKNHSRIMGIEVLFSCLYISCYQMPIFHKEIIWRHRLHLIIIFYFRPQCWYHHELDGRSPWGNHWHCQSWCFRKQWWIVAVGSPGNEESFYEVGYWLVSFKDGWMSVSIELKLSFWVLQPIRTQGSSTCADMFIGYLGKTHRIKTRKWTDKNFWECRLLVCHAQLYFHYQSKINAANK